MPFYIDDDPGEELRVLTEWDRRTTAAQARQPTPQQAETLAQWAELAPHVDPEAMLSAARAGITPTSAAGQRLIDAGAVDYYQGFRRGQEPSIKPEFPSLTKGGTPSEARGFWEQVGGAVRAVRDWRDEVNDVGRTSARAATEPVGDALDFINEGRQVAELTNPVVGEAADNPVANVLRPTARTAFMALDASRQELVGSFRDVVGDVRQQGVAGALNPFDDPVRLPESDALIAAGDLLTGKPVDVGAGLYVDPESGVAQERYRRELSHGTIDGQTITVGRWFTDTFTGLDRGDTGYGFLSGLVDAGVAMGADPVDWAGGAVIRAARARRAFAGGAGALAAEDALEEVGLLPRGLVPDVDRPTAADWLTSGPGAAIVDELAGDDDFYRLWLSTGRGERISPDVLLRIADESDPDVVRRIVFDEARLSIGPDFTYARPDLSRGTWTRRAFSEMPVTRVRTDEPVSFLQGLEGLLVNARVPTDDIGRLMRQGAEAATPLDRINVFERGLQTVNRTIVDSYGVHPDVARQLTGWITEQHAVQRRMFNLADESAATVASRPATGTLLVDGRPNYLRHAHLDSEMAPEVFTIPNVREIRRLTGSLRGMGPLLMDEAGKLRLPYRFLEGLSNNVWKRVTLLRLAWPVRQVLIDEQLRLAATGLPSMYRHPIQLLAAMLDDSFERKLLEAGEDPNAVLHAADEFQGAQLQHIPYSDVKRRALDEWNPIFQDDQRFVEAWGRELSQLHASPVARRLADNHSVEATVNDLLDGDLADLGRSLANRPHDAIVGEAALRDWVESIAERIRVKTGGNPDLIDAVRDGHLAANGVHVPFWNGTEQPAELAGHLAGYLDAAPLQVKAESDLVTRLPARAADSWEKATDTLFGWLSALPSNRLSRSPAWRHNYFETLIEKFPLLSEDAQASALAAARRSRTAAGLRVEALGRDIGVGGDLLHRMEQAAARGVTGDVEWDAANQFARTQAMMRTQDLLGDFVTKNHLADAVRIMMPFAPAWREMISAYMKILKQNPLIVYDIGKGVRGSIQAGFFYQDTNGEWVFNYPGSEQLMANIPGGPHVPFPLTGRVQGLTMGFEVVPGFGPMAQLPASWVIPNTPHWDGVRSLVMPYGVEADQRILVPEWLERVAIFAQNADPDVPGAEGFLNLVGGIFGGSSSDASAQYASSVGDVMTYLSSTGDYDLSRQSEVARLADDARERAAALWLWRGLSQFSLPSAPRPLAQFFDDEDHLTVIPVAAERYYQLLEEDPIHAGQRFLDEFGELAFMILEPKSRSNALYTPGDRAGYDWAREHADTLERFPTIGGLFAPTGGGDAGIGAYLRAVETGERAPQDPQERFYRAQDQLGSILYNLARAQAMKAALRNGRSSIPEAGMDALREYREQLMDRYPGYLREGRGIRDIERTITDLEDAMADEPLFRESEAGVALREYLDLRAYALSTLQANTDADSLTSQAAAPLREVLRRQGETLVAEHRDFGTVWDRVLSRELEVQE